MGRGAAPQSARKSLNRVAFPPGKPLAATTCSGHAMDPGPEGYPG